MDSKQLLLKLNTVLLESPNVGKGLDQALRIVLDYLGYDIAFRWRADYDSLSMHCIHIEALDSSNSVGFASLSMARKFAPGEGGPGRAWLSRRLVVIPDLSKDTNFPRLLVASRCGLCSYVAFPVIFEKHVFGLFEFLSSRAVIESEDKLRDLEDAGRMIGQFLYKQGLEGFLATTPTGATLATSIATEAIITINTDTPSCLSTLLPAKCLVIRSGNSSVSRSPASCHRNCESGI